MHQSLRGPVFTGFLLVIFAVCLRAENAPAEPMTHGELARKICYISGLAESMKPPITASAAIMALSERGWAPLSGWRCDAYATREDFYVVMAKYLNLRPEGSPDQAQSYYKALASEGYFVDVGQTAESSPDPAPPRFSADAPAAASRIVLVCSGTVECRRLANKDWQPLSPYDPVSEGMEIRTQAQSEVNLIYAPGCAQQIKENSLVRVKKLSSGNAPIEVAIAIDYGKTYTFINPLPANSSFTVESPYGTLAVDVNEGCEFESDIQNADPIALNEHERPFAMNQAILSPIQEGHSQHINFHGRAVGTHSSGAHEILKSGQSLFFLAQGLRLGKADSFDFGKIAGLVTRLERLTHEYLLTESEIRAFLANLSSGGTCEVHVTPIGR